MSREARTSPVDSPSRNESWAVLPGLAACAAAVGIALFVGHFLPTVSTLLIAIVLGVVMRNAFPVPSSLESGLTVAAKKLLRLGVVLLGLQVSLHEIAGLGAGMIGVVIAVVGLGIVFTLLIGRLLGIGFTSRLLIGCGFSICGAAAVAAVDGVVEAEEEEVVTSVALVVIFGTLMIPLVPLAGELLGLSNTQTGLWAGASIHEVAQVVAAGGAVGSAALGLAVVVKLARVMMLAPVMAIVGWRQRRLNTASAGGKRPPLIPLFVLGFIAMSLLRTTGLLSDPVLDGGRIAQTALLSAAMFALGAGVHISVIRRVGLRPFLLAAFSTIFVAAVGLCGVLLVA
ncbi:putative sulfate exporter family transporter [Saxibacter everestensis]|uniref:Sulfate exporter family transporter n=1 Tax=Saxibacter everestensis TaxID=2909229 RepID=A0ABY8QRN7_9MICO|nr:putative sulfate exporter family transporter [Brevibacteriaceae bacterium ZFBP1038]